MTDPHARPYEPGYSPAPQPGSEHAGPSRVTPPGYYPGQDAYRAAHAPAEIPIATVGYGANIPPRDSEGRMQGPNYAPHLHGAKPVSVGKRIAVFILHPISIVLTSVVIMLVLMIFRLITTGGGALMSWTMLATLVGFAFFIYYCLTGFFPVGKILGVRQVRAEEQRAPGWAGVGKYLLENIIASISANIAWLVIVLATRDEDERTWFDRASGIYVVDVREGRDPLVSDPAPVLQETSPTSQSSSSEGNPSW